MESCIQGYEELDVLVPQGILWSERRRAYSELLNRLELMPCISTDEVARVAGLAHIALTSEEIERIAGELDAIAVSATKVSEVVTVDIPVTSHATPLINVMREDIVSPTLNRGEVLSQAPAFEEGMLLVPQVLGGE